MGVNSKTAPGWPRILALGSILCIGYPRRVVWQLVQLTSVTDPPGLAEEQAALRRLATLVAQQPSPTEVFAAITTSAAALFDVPFVSLFRYGRRHDSATMVAGCAACSAYVGQTWAVPPDDPGIVRTVVDSRLPARIEVHTGVRGPMGEVARVLGIGSVVGAPVIVDGEIWGVLAVGADQAGTQLPADAADRLIGFTELVTTTLINAETREGLRRLADEQAALRRVATLVARGVRSEDVFVAVCDEVARLVDAEITTIARFDRDEPHDLTVVGLSSDYRDITLGTRSPQMEWLASSVVHRTGRTARKDVTAAEITDAHPVADSVRARGFFSTVSAPIVVEGELWGVLTASSSQASLPPNTEKRVESFGELVATALADAQSRAELADSEARARALAEKQAALRRVATLVATADVPPAQFFSAVAREVAAVLNVPGVIVTRYEDDGMAVVFGDAFASDLSGAEEYFGVGSRAPLDPGSLAAQVFETHGPARIDDFSTLPGTVGELARAAQLGSGCAGPIMVNGELWGKMCVFSGTDSELPAGTEDRLNDFIELVATAIANHEARTELAASEARAFDLANEQAALRRIATLVAESAAPQEVFDAVRREVAEVFDVPFTVLWRFGPDGTATVLSADRSYLGPSGTVWPLEGDTSIAARVRQTGRAARVDFTAPRHSPGSIADAARRAGVRSGVGVPIVVEGECWGSMTVGSETAEPLPAELERRLERFTELLATAIANAKSREEVTQLAAEQAALRRVATLVAEGADPGRVFSAVAVEVAGVVDIPIVRVNRFEADGTFTMVGIAGETDFDVNSRWPVPEDGIAGMILTTGRPARKDDYSTMRGPLGDALREDQTVATVGVPIVVGGSIWGFMVAASKPGRPIPADAETRLTRFTELVATAVSNATTRAELLTSRTRLVSAADESRRRLERDLHDGIQQWLVALALKARKAAALSGAGESPAAELSGLADDLVGVTDELREISRGIHPAILSDAGLDEALEALARKSAIRVDLDVSFRDRYDPTLEATVYYVVAESITNAVKHAQVSTVEVRGGLRDGRIEFEIKDDGVGGADPRRGTGLMGLTDRVDTLGGTISFVSPAGAGTTIRVTLPAGPRVGEDPPLQPASRTASSSASG